MLIEEEIKEFKKIWTEEFGETISYQEAHNRAIEIATFFEAIAGRKPTAPSATNFD